MEKSALLVLISIAIPLWLNVRATRLIVRDHLAENRQKAIQLLIVWLLPLLGAIIVLGVHRPEEPPSRQYRTPSDPGDDFGFPNRASGRSREGIDPDD
jgi:hypothetical protein